jgi:hypothetical protein
MRNESLAKILLDELRAQMYIQLYEWDVANATEAVDLAGLDHQDVTCPGFELLTIDLPHTAPLLNELHFIIGVAVRARPTARLAIEQEDGYADLAVACADKMMGAAPERQIRLTYSQHNLTAS